MKMTTTTMMSSELLKGKGRTLTPGPDGGRGTRRAWLLIFTGKIERASEGGGTFLFRQPYHFRFVSRAQSLGEVGKNFKNFN